MCPVFFLIHKFITRCSIAVRGKRRNLTRKAKPRSLATDPDAREVRKEGKKKKTGMKEQYSVTP